MNFLEQLAAEWYDYKGFFVRTNIKFGRTKKGGYQGEMDVAVYDPRNRTLMHVEASTDSWTLSKRKDKFLKKFTTAKKYYMELFPYNTSLKQLAIVSLRNKAPKLEILGVEVKSIPEFIKEIVSELQAKNPTKEMIPEVYPLLRAIQLSVAFGKTRIN